MNSNRKTVFISIAGIVVAIAIMIGVGFGIAKRVRPNMERLQRPSVERTVESSDAGKNLSFDLSGFTEVRTEGGWTVTINHSDEFSVNVTASDRAVELVDVFQRGEVLHLTMDSGIQGITGNLKAVVTLPDLERVQTAGGVSMDISGFDLDRLEVDVDGAANISATDGSIGDLFIEGDGASNFNFSRVRVGDAEVDMDGASSLNINMDGGELTGVLRGLGEVTFSGEVSNEHIRIDGLGRVRRQ